jgi:hypothetical protein
MSDLPVYCTLTPETIETRKAQLLPGLATRAVETTPTPDGYRLRFAASSDILGQIATAIDAERRCCRFLRFDVVVEPDDGPITVTLSGPRGTREFLAALLA